VKEVDWDIASRAQKNKFAEDAGLIRPSAFDRDLPCWHELPQKWKDRLDPQGNGSTP